MLALLRDARTNQEIADILGISTAGAAYHVSEILSKLGVSSRYEAAQVEPNVARRRGFGAIALGDWFHGPALSRLGRASSVAVLSAAAGFFLLLALGVWLMSMRDSNATGTLDCVTGEAATNPVDDSGKVQRRGELFESVAEAEAFICQDVPEIQSPADWHLVYALGERTNSLSLYTDNMATFDITRHVSATYAKDQDGQLYAGFTLISTQPLRAPYIDCTWGDGELSTAMVLGSEATVWARWESGGGATICWESERRSFYVEVVLHEAAEGQGSAVIAEVLGLLESIE